MDVRGRRSALIDPEASFDLLAVERFVGFEFGHQTFDLGAVPLEKLKGLRETYPSTDRS